MIRLEALPAAHGDSLLLSWGKGRNVHRMLIDGGPLGTYRVVHDRIAALGSKPNLEALIVTHIDGDHLRIGDVWFNGWPQLSAISDTQGADQGEMVGAMIQRDALPWNTPFKDGPVVRPPDDDKLDVISLPGDATATILGPGVGELRKLRKDWVKVLKQVGVRPGDAKGALERLTKRKSLAGIEDVQGGEAPLDNSTANGSSISFLFEHKGHSVLLTGDSHGDVLATGIRRLLAERDQEKLRVDIFKLPHHGSRANVTEDLLSLVETPNYVISTNGARYHHPDREAMLRVLQQKHEMRPTLWFNHESKTTLPWGSAANTKKFEYDAVFPDNAAAGAVLEV
jgi:hypothetical protein